MGIEERLSSGAAHPCCAAPNQEGGKESGMQLKTGLRSAQPRGGVPTEKVVWSGERNIEVAIHTEERRRGLRSTYYCGGAPFGGGGGGIKQPTMCN